MRPPATAVIGNLIWSRAGRVWAIWRVPTTPYRWLSDRQKHAEHSRIRALLAALPAESMILSVAARVDPGEVAQAMMADVVLEERPGWVDAVDAVLDGLETVELYRRRHYLCVQLPQQREGGRARQWWRSAVAPVLDGFRLSAPPIPAAEVRAAVRRADDLRAQLRTVRLETPTSGEVAWIYARSIRRGLPAEPPLTGWPEPRVRWLPRDGKPAVAAPSLAPLVEASFRNGGGKGDADRPWHRRYLRVETDDGVSYQAFSVVADAPEQFGFPGGLSEWLLVADQMPFPVDWCARIRAVPNQAAARSATRQQRELAGQVAEYDAEPAGPPPSLAAAMDAVDDERAELAANPSEPELHVSMVYAVWADALPELERRVGWLTSLYRGSEYHLARPTGGQLDLFEAMLPGAITPRVGDDYRQYLLPRDLAASMPFAGVALGDASGMLLGASRDAGCLLPVLLDPAAGPRHDRDGSIAAFGALGSGKSYLAKRLASTVLLRGGHVVLIDRTQAGEYVRFARALDGLGMRTQTLTVGGNGQHLLLDPLKVFTGPDAKQAAAGYLGLVCGTDPTSLEAATLARAVRRVHDRGGRLADVPGVLDDLAADGDEYRHARELSLRLASIAENRFGAPVWTGGARSIATDVDCTVVHLPNLAVPGREVLLSEHLSRRLLAEQVCSLGLLYLTAALARHVAYARQDVFAALLLDEAWALTSTIPGQQLLLDLLRDGRKHNAAGWIFSQHPNDLPAEARDLVSTRFIFGLTGTAAADGLNWLGVDSSRANLDLLEGWAARRDPDTAASEQISTPDCLMRDAAGRIGRVQIAPAETEALHLGFESNPVRLAARRTAGDRRGNDDTRPAVEEADPR